MRREARGDIGEARAAAEVAGRDAGAEAQDRDVLASMVRAAEGRVVAVIGRDDADVALAEQSLDPRQPRVESLERRPLARHVALTAISVSKSTRLAKTSPPVGSSRKAPSASARFAMLPAPLRSVPSRDARRCRRSSPG